MAEIALRPYQEKFIANIRREFKLNQRRVVGVAPCGAGKTIMTGWMIRESQKRGKSAIFFVHRKELIDQTSKTFYDLHIPHGIIAGGVKPHYEFPVQIASVQTLVKRMDILNPPDLLVCDECHHILANTYKQIIDNWSDSYLLGVTATPIRLGGITLSDIFQSMVQAPQVNDLIQLGNLTNFQYFAMDINIELEDIAVVHGDYSVKGLSKLMNDPRITKAIIDSYIKYANGKSAICYCVDVEHSQSVANFFNSVGVPAAHCDGTTPKAERENIVEDFRHGIYKVLCNAELFGEGFDVPNCHAVILARPTQSLALHIQQSMRSMRPDPADKNKIAIIIDCVGNYKKHGYPDALHDWSLEINNTKINADAPTKICPHCKNIIPLPAEVCPVCGMRLVYRELNSIGDTAFIYSSAENNSFATEPQIIRRETSIEHFLDIAKDRKYKSYWAVMKALNFAKTYDDLLHIADVMGYKKGWAFHKALELNIFTKKSLQKNPSQGTI